MKLYAVKYYAGTYSGIHRVFAEDGQDAIDKTRAWVRRQMTIPMYTDGYKLVDPDIDENETD